MLALKEALRYGLFLGCFAVTFVSVDEFLASLGSHQRQVFYSLFMEFLCDSMCKFLKQEVYDSFVPINR